jgi:hypothetical protein
MMMKVMRSVLSYLSNINIISKNGKKCGVVHFERYTVNPFTFVEHIFFVFRLRLPVSNMNCEHSQKGAIHKIYWT